MVYSGSKSWQISRSDVSRKSSEGLLQSATSSSTSVRLAVWTHFKKLLVASTRCPPPLTAYCKVCMLQAFKPTIK